MTPVDLELVQRAVDGDQLARGELVARWARRVLATCRARTGREDVAEDLAQETLLRACRSLPTLEDPKRFGAWVRGIAIRVCLDWIRRQTRDRDSFALLTVDAPSASHLDPAIEVGLHDERTRVTQLIDDLPEELREPLLLFYYDDMTYDDIAAVLGVSRATVNARLARARRVLTSRLDIPSRSS